MSERFRLRVEAYITKTRNVLKEMKITQPFSRLDRDDVNRIIDYVKRYFEDACFYLEKGDLETALASISYCEGLLDALRLLGIAEFEWQ